MRLVYLRYIGGMLLLLAMCLERLAVEELVSGTSCGGRGLLSPVEAVIGSIRDRLWITTG